MGRWQRCAMQSHRPPSSLPVMTCARTPLWYRARPVEVDSLPPLGSTSASIVHIPALETAVNLMKTLLATAGAAVMVSACESAPVVTTTSVQTGPSLSSSAAPIDTARDKAIDAYRQMWRDFAAAAETSDWQSSSLSRHATGTALNKLSQSLYGDSYRGIVTKGAPVLNPSVSNVDPANDPARVVIMDCGDSTTWLKYRRDNGSLADDKPGGRHLINSTVEKQVDGSWKVSDYGVHDVGSC
jgi:hypothetical protein